MPSIGLNDFQSDGNVLLTAQSAKFTADVVQDGGSTGGRIVYDVFTPVGAIVDVEAQMNVSNILGFCTSMTFLEDYNIPARDSQQDELDFEILSNQRGNGQQNNAETVAFRNGQNNGTAVSSMIDPTKTHTFRIELRLGIYVKFYIDGRVVSEINDPKKVPNRAMKLGFGLWRPNNDWSGRIPNVPPGTQTTAEVFFPVKVSYSNPIDILNNRITDNGIQYISGNQLNNQHRLVSGNQNYNLRIENGKLRFHGNHDWQPHEDPEGDRLILQADGNLVFYNRGNQAVWATGTNPNEDRPLTLVVQNDGNLVLYDRNSAVLWVVP